MGSFHYLMCYASLWEYIDGVSLNGIHQNLIIQYKDVKASHA